VYCLSQKEECKKLQRHLKWSSHRSAENRAFGYSVSTSYLAYVDEITHYSNHSKAWIITTRNTYEELMRDEELEKPQPTQRPLTFTEKLSVVEKSVGTFSNTYYLKRTIEDYSCPKPYDDQKEVIDLVLDCYNRQKHCVVFVSGPPNAGKSFLGILLAKALNGLYCKDFTPWYPGDGLRDLYAYCRDLDEPSKHVILSLDEIDDALHKISNGEIERNKNVMTSVMDKQGWVSMFDDIERGLFPQLLVLMTSNKPLKQLQEELGDESYLRKGRIDLYFTLQSK
jgi:Mrp family chromosome partitioning ATPase